MERFSLFQPHYSLDPCTPGITVEDLMESNQISYEEAVWQYEQCREEREAKERALISGYLETYVVPIASGVTDSPPEAVERAKAELSGQTPISSFLSNVQYKVENGELVKVAEYAGGVVRPTGSAAQAGTQSAAAAGGPAQQRSWILWAAAGAVFLLLLVRRP